MMNDVYKILYIIFLYYLIININTILIVSLISLYISYKIFISTKKNNFTSKCIIRLKLIKNIVSTILKLIYKFIIYKIKSVYQSIYNKYINRIEIDEKNKLLKIKYNYNDKEYILCQKINNDINNILNCVTENNEDITELLLKYLGPSRTNYCTPKILGYNKIEINFITDDFDVENKYFTNNEIIII